MHTYVYIFPQIRVTYYLTVFLKISLLQNYCTFQCGIKIINRKNPICLVPLETGSLIILPTVFSSSVVPDYQAQKTPVKPNSLQGPVSSQRNKSLEFVQLDTIACNGMNRVCAAI